MLASSTTPTTPTTRRTNVNQIETDYLVIGSGTAGLAFTDTLIDESPNAHVTLVDSSCNPICNVGDVDCANDEVVTCELGSDGCPG